MPGTPSILQLIISLVVGGSSVLLSAAELRIHSVAAQPGRTEVRFPGETGFYHILRRGDSVTDIRLATDLVVSDGGQNVLTDTNATSNAQFYQIEKVSLASLRDTDGDGLSDAWELQHRRRGAVLNGSDAEEDQDANGVPDRMDALRASLREGAVGGRPVLAAGVYHTLAIKGDGTLWGWGDNIAGELGVTGFTEANIPLQINADTNWVAVSAGSLMSFGLKADGSLWAWGLQNNPGSVLAPVQVGPGMRWIGLPKARFSDAPTALREDGTRWQILGGSTNLQQLGSDTDWRAVSDGMFSQHWAIKGDRSLWSGLSVFDTNRVWSAISGGFQHALALQTNGTLWSWVTRCCGLLAPNGELGIGSGAQPTVPTQVGTNVWAAASAGINHSIGIQSDGSLWWWGINRGFESAATGFFSTNAPARLGTNVDWVAVTAGEYHSAALRADGSLWTFGVNELGKLGNATTTQVKEPARIGLDSDWAAVAAGTVFSFGLKTNGTLWSWGGNDFGVLGAGDFQGSAAPRQIPGSNWRAVSGGGDHTVALQEDGSLWIWGKHIRRVPSSQDLFTNLPVRLGADTDWRFISAGDRHALALKENGSLWSWGVESSGQLGTGLGSSSVPLQVGSAAWTTASAGHNNSLGVQAFRSLWSWGQEIGGMGGDFSPQQVGSDFWWSSVANGKRHSVYPHALALKRNGTLWSWGNNLAGQLGNGTTVSTTEPEQQGSSTNWSSVAVGDQVSGALQRDGSLWMAGNNFYGQLGLGTRSYTNRFTRVGTETNWASISAGYRHMLGLKSDGSIWAWGDNSYGQCAQPALFEPAPVPGTNWGRMR